MMLRQYKLSAGTETMVVWLEDGRVNIGDIVTLKDSEDPTRNWRVREEYTTADDKDLHGQSAADNWNKHNNI